MKKTILLIAAALLLGAEMKAQELADATTFNFSQAENAQVNSIYTAPMPTSDFVVNNQFGTQQFASRKGWGVACIVSGGLTMIGGITTWLSAGMFNQTVSQMPTENDPDFQQGQQAVQAVGNGIKTVGIIGTVVGAALVGTGIWLVSSDNGTSYRRNSYRRYRRFAEGTPTTEPARPSGWALGVTSNGLTLVF